MDTSSWIMLIVIIALIGCSSFFSLSETSISTFNKIRIRKKAEDGDKNAKKVLYIWDNFDKTLSAILIGNTVANVTAATMAAALFASFLGAATGTVVATVFLTLTTLIFGEIVPKSYGKENADKTALKVAEPLNAITVLLSPLSAVFLKLTFLIKHRSGKERAPSITEEELIYMMDTIEEEGVLEEQERDLVQSALAFDEIPIGDILTPRVNITAIDIDAKPEDVKKTVIESGFSRIPVYQSTIDKIVGVLYTRDYLLAMVNGGEIRLRGMLGNPLFVHKGMKLSHLLASFKAKKLNLAVVVDEYGGTLGIVTMEDILEELVGEIWDEDDEIPIGFIEAGEGRFEVEGDFDLWDMLEKLQIDEESVDSDYSTVSGWALKMFRHIPAVNESFEFRGFRFHVLDMDGRRLKTMEIKKLPVKTDGSGPSETEKIRK
ncbi:MAG: hemolysin family protein [Oscillospiraceae bacterium]|nr:hemolysin family protein [Oscillospiraceae bacterium]